MRATYCVEQVLATCFGTAHDLRMGKKQQAKQKRIFHGEHLWPAVPKYLLSAPL